MGTRVYHVDKMKEFLNNVKKNNDEYKKRMDDINEKLTAIETSDSFTGRLGDSIKSYITKVEKPMIMDITNNLQRLNTQISNIQKGFSDIVDHDDKAVISQFKLKWVMEDFKNGTRSSTAYSQTFKEIVNAINAELLKIKDVTKYTDNWGKETYDIDLSIEEKNAVDEIEHVANYAKNVDDRVEEFESNYKDKLKITEGKEVCFEATNKRLEHNLKVVELKDATLENFIGFLAKNDAGELDIEKLDVQKENDELAKAYSEKYYVVRDGKIIILDDKIKELANKKEDELTEEDYMGYIYFLSHNEFNEEQLEQIINASFINEAVTAEANRKIIETSPEGVNIDENDLLHNEEVHTLKMSPTMKKIYEMYYLTEQTKIKMMSDSGMFDKKEIKNERYNELRSSLTKAKIFYQVSEYEKKVFWTANTGDGDGFETKFKVESINDGNGYSVKAVGVSWEENICSVYDFEEAFEVVQELSKDKVIDNLENKIKENHKNDMLESHFWNILSILPFGPEIKFTMFGVEKSIAVIGALIAAKGIRGDYLENKTVDSECNWIKKYVDGKKCYVLKYLEANAVVTLNEQTNEISMDYLTIDKPRLMYQIALYNEYAKEDLKLSDFEEKKIQKNENLTEFEKRKMDSERKVDKYIEWRKEQADKLSRKYDREQDYLNIYKDLSDKDGGSEVWKDVAIENGIFDQKESTIEEFAQEYNMKKFTQEDWDNIIRTYNSGEIGKLDESAKESIEKKRN